MTQNEKQKIQSIFNALNTVEVKGIANVNNIAGCLNILSEMLAEEATDETKPNKRDGGKG